jgi:hypothetical protein
LTKNEALQQFSIWSAKRAWGVPGEDVGSMDAAVKPPRMGLRRSSTGTPYALNTVKMLKLRIAAKHYNAIVMTEEIFYN